MRKKMLRWAPVALLAFVIFIALGGLIVRELWNWLLPMLFDVRQITFWQALGVLALSRILFGGFGLHGSNHGGFRRRRMAERWEKMTPEERERFREGFQGRFCADRSPDPADQ